MRCLVILTLCTVILGCGSTPKPIPPEKLVIKETRYIIRVPPAELLSLPPPVQPLDVDTADQLAVANWLIDKERYTLEIQNKLKRIAEFLKSEQTKLDDQARDENKP